MRKGFTRILFAIRDVEKVTPAALRKVAMLARGSGARVELYHALTETIVVPRPLGSRPGPSLDDIFDGYQARRAPILVDDNGQLHAPLLKLAQ